MRKNLPDRKKLTKRELMNLEKHHYEKPDWIYNYNYKYHKNTCMKKAQEDFQKKEEVKDSEKKEVKDKK